MIEFVKGHGTENDFVLLPDLDDRLDLTADLVRRVCDRRAGIGADGVLRVVREPAGSAARFFMDYRNADGSVAEMCGNGIRVFARYLVESGLADEGSVAIRTRAGVLEVTVGAESITAGLGTYELPEVAPVQVRPGDRWLDATAVRMPNPHLVALVDDVRDPLAVGDLLRPPTIEPTSAAPEGANVELVQLITDEHVAMRVHERGAGETRSCGTGAAAAAVVAAQTAGRLPADGDAPVAVRVDVPGGTLVVTIYGDRTVDLTGPAVLVAAGTFFAS